MAKGITNIVSESKLKSLFVETFLNHTNNVSKISDLSVLNAVSYGFAKLFRKIIKDIAIVEAKIIPELSYGSYLDDAAKNFGVSSRKTAVGSSTFILVNADPGTVYIPGVSRFLSNQGIIFDITSITIIPTEGYGYVPVSSSNSGLITNVSPFSINTISNPPVGHISCTNEYQAIGGRDNESDIEFKNRISKHEFTASKGTLSKILSELQLIDPTIYSLKKMGVFNGKVVIGVLSCNGKHYTTSQLSNFLKLLKDKLSISDYSNQFSGISFELVNPTWQYIGGSSGIDFRIKFSGDEDEIRKNIQISLTKYFDFKTFTDNKIQWEDLLNIVKSVDGVEYVPDEFFYPNSDEDVDEFSVPRVVKFVMRDLYGGILYNNDSNILSVYYQ